jgi:sedoheptulokinase
MTSSYALGIDIGTTKVAVAVVDTDTRDVVATALRAHESDVRGLVAGRSEQVVSKILANLDACVEQIPLEERRGVACIGVTGQMHGVVMWNRRTGDISHVVTWQDQRCVEDNFIERLRVLTGDPSAQSGYGTSTLAWFSAHEPEMLERYSSAATIHDYVVAMISGSDRPYTDPSDAASFGFFDLAAQRWREDCVEKAAIPRHLLPDIQLAGARVGSLSAEMSARWGIREGIPVGNAVGDNQASLYGSLTDPPHQVALTIGTGAQLSVVVPLSHTKSLPMGASYEFRPYVGDSAIAVVASLSGGRALATLGRALEEFMKELGVDNPPGLEAIQTAMHRQGLERISSDLIANASLSGERHAPHLRGSFTNLSFDTFTIGDMTAALCRGLVTSLKEGLPADLLSARREVVGSGNAIRRSPLMQQIIRETFGCALKLQDGAEPTASGAALLAGDCLL